MDIKPGYLTTEFWGKLVVQVVALLTLTGVIHPASGFTDALVGIIGMVGPEIGYAISRGVAKSATTPPSTVVVTPAVATAPTPAAAAGGFDYMQAAAAPSSTPTPAAVTPGA